MVSRKDTGKDKGISDEEGRLEQAEGVRPASIIDGYTGARVCRGSKGVRVRAVCIDRHTRARICSCGEGVRVRARIVYCQRLWSRPYVKFIWR